MSTQSTQPKPVPKTEPPTPSRTPPDGKTAPPVRDPKVTRWGGLVQLETR